MADNNLSSNVPPGKDTTKGGIFFGSSLTPAGTFSNIPLTTSTPPPNTTKVDKLTLTLEQLREELNNASKAETGSSDGTVLSDQSINTFLSTFIQLLIDYRDLKNYVFFGSAYTELAYHVNFLTTNYPFESFFARDVNNILSPAFTLTPLVGNKTRVSFDSSHILQPANYVYDNSGNTNWVKYDLVDKNSTRFPVLTITGPVAIVGATNSGPIVITTDKDHNFLTGDQVIVGGVTGNTSANGPWTITVLSAKQFSLDTSVGIGAYIAGGTVNLANNRIILTVTGNVSINNLVEYLPTPAQHFKGLIVSLKVQTLTDFNVSLHPVQKALLSSTNQTPWPRDPITNNIIVTGIAFDTWVANPALEAPTITTEDIGIVDPGLAVNLVGATSLDETETNQLIRRAIPEKIVDELNDTDDKFFTRFILIAGKFFDSLKIYIDFLQYTHTVNYGDFNQLSPEFYKIYAEHYGFDLFEDDNIDLAKAVIRTEPGLRYDSQDNPVFDNTADSKTIQQLQNEKQKRLLVNLFFLYRTKGTQKCIQFLTSLLGSPEGLIILQEFAFNTTSGLKIVDNTKFNVPELQYEIDPDYLVNPSNLNDPANLPYVYRLKLDNDNITNLREISLGTDPQGAIATQILNFGKTLYAYGTFKPGAFANLQNVDQPGGYYLLPLAFPSKYYGITTEYMIPKDGFIKGIGRDNDEVTFHLGSLYEVAGISYSGPNLVPLTSTDRYSYPVPPFLLDDNNAGNQEINTVALQTQVQFTLNTLKTLGQALDVYINGVLIGSTTWKSTLKQTALDIINAIDFDTTSPIDWKGFYKEDPANGGYTVIIKGPKTTNVTAYNNLQLTVNTNAVLDPDVLGNGDFTVGGRPFTNDKQYVISRIEGNDLVVRIRARDENNILMNLSGERVAIFEDVFSADGINHQLRLLFRPEGVEVYQDFKFLGLALWLDPTTASSGPYTSLDIPKDQIPTCTALRSSIGILAYPDKDPNPGGPNTGFDVPRWWDMMVGLPTNINVFINRVSVFDTLSIDLPDVLDFGLDISGQEDEKYSFSFNNQEIDTLTNPPVKFPFKFSVPVTYRAPDPDAVGTDLTIETFFSSLAINNIIDSVRLVNQSYLGGEVNYIEDVQYFYKMPNGIPVTLENLFKYNAWSPTIHKDYNYKTFYNVAYKNYELFSTSVLTYLALLPFMELIETKFRKLVSQFIPIVINISDFGRILRENPFDLIKVHYADIHHICDGTAIKALALATFRVENGSYNPGVNKIEVKIGGVTYSLQDWQSSNKTTAINIAAEINAGPNYPMVQAIATESTVIIEVDPNWYYLTFAIDINTVAIEVNTFGNAVVAGITGFRGGQKEIIGDTCFILERDPRLPSIPASYNFIYYESENAPVVYIYISSELKPDLFIE